MVDAHIGGLTAVKEFGRRQESLTLRSQQGDGKHPALAHPKE